MSSNILVTVGHDLKVAAVDTAHAAEAIVGAIPKVISVLATALKDEPAVKSAVLELVQKFGTVTADGTLAVASKGANLVEDAATVTAAEQFFAYFRDSFIPIVENLYGEVKADLT